MSDRELQKRPRKPHGASIRWKLIAYFLSFLAITFLIVGVFQILLLDFFFESVKKVELELTAESLIPSLGRDNLQIETSSQAVERSMSIAIYRVQGEEAIHVAGANAGGEYRDHWMDSKFLSEIYKKALENGGAYQTKMAFGGYEIPDERPWWQIFHRSEDKDSKIPAENIRLVYVRIAKAEEDGAYYILFLNSKLLPLNSTVETLKMQFVWIVCILVLAASVMVFLLYRKISKPLIRMNESAKQLARGRYDVPFSGQGYRETRELADTLNYAAMELSKVDRLQKELIANISHDLRTPLTMIRGYGEMMRDIPGENTPENMQLIIDETARLSALVNDLLDLSKMQAGSIVPRFEVFDLTEAIEETMERYDAFTKHQGYRILWDGQGEAYVWADRSMILQVLYNLINNAINYTGEDRSVTVTLVTDGKTVRVNIADTGAGIPQDEVPYIWDRYYRIDKVHKRAMVGSGLGLSIVKEILDKHRAGYGVSSTLQKGSVFWFELPVIHPTQRLESTTNEEETH
ncbi:MAG: HAMP domain-containing histidine kinase [Clostridia bacterium]|nr:HAMP domain-containing histidine kinase [Clostridia bacterium]